jgi:DNA polymerase-3 subunit delta
MILKSYIVEQNIDILKKYKATLIYGENNGIKDDIKEEIRNKNKNSDVINFFENDLFKNNLLYENIANRSLFTERKIIFIQEASDKIFEQIEECLKKENKEIKVYIFADKLEKKSKLRNLFEKDKGLAIFPCYEDNERTLISYISNKLKHFRGLTGEITNIIISNSNMNRRVIKNELEKIIGFFLEKKINKEQILELLNVKHNTQFDEIRDKALMGEKLKINKLLSETEIMQDETFFYLNSLNYRISRLYEITKISSNEKNFEKILESLKPPIFWKDKPIILKQLKKWSQKKLEKMLVKIGEAEILMKKNSYINNELVIKNLIVSLTNKASTF